MMILNSWQTQYLVVLLLSSFMIVIRLMPDILLARERPSLWVDIPYLAGEFLGTTPFGWCVLFFLNLNLFLSGAPLDVFLTSSVFSAFCLFLGVSGIIPPRL